MGSYVGLVRALKEISVLLIELFSSHTSGNYSLTAYFRTVSPKIRGISVRIIWPIWRLWIV